MRQRRLSCRVDPKLANDYSGYLARWNDRRARAVLDSLRSCFLLTSGTLITACGLRTTRRRSPRPSCPSRAPFPTTESFRKSASRTPRRPYDNSGCRQVEVAKAHVSSGWIRFTIEEWTHRSQLFRTRNTPLSTPPPLGKTCLSVEQLRQTFTQSFVKESREALDKRAPELRTNFKGEDIRGKFMHKLQDGEGKRGR